MKPVLLVISTELNKKSAKKIAKLLIKKKLAACVSLKDINSIYEWEGKVVEVNEVEITIKSKLELKNDLIVFLRKMLSYDLPQIVYKKFKSEKNYMNWINKSCLK
ncbi:CutA1 divalent ion tolerance protein [Prochlorococcus marinus str. MIT 9515]|uniref:CutA1 divalent ion tolerance protein n=1 Tax=Prochlorococcus marinus (strain MIT 9515) TaxID=167542 RepID=A2BVG6_PROM5|nr:CutA1 divalent ion tolerance protein [Prochlorococcus marinus str. MIT 9515]